MKIPNLDQDPTGRTWLLQTALTVLGFDLVIDNWPGPKTTRALELYAQQIERDEWHEVKASSFADIADVRRFKTCKATGKTDLQCFAVGDNGIGKWGANTAQESTPMVALPPDDWQPVSKRGGAAVEVEYNGRRVHMVLGDSMPWKRNIKNGAGIDLNPAAAKMLGLTPPFMVAGVKWRWA